ncbi:hypothetical protein [Candidatus Palauibacter polyketidifaciens]|uniref:hypothetical protein n=1 Tax=Candidatus Palauibacter polyketidifaciens TaxID=3056740 RepID=UPI00139EA290|nr:hypothetical protein [Candidatus Palauibacter polyketidifaciens]MDE2720877.1 hypothetical protein [Candidatus Palauibacter polyketidifaciens]MYE33322.1 hypothetical protein [Gemmatimonadales bacterium]
MNRCPKRRFLPGFATLPLLLLAADTGFAQAHPNPATPDSLRQIQTMEPRIGPPGTEVSLYTENIPLQARVVVGLGAIGTGFEELGTGDQGEFGEIGATVSVPETATWDRAVVFIIFNGNFAPTGLSDPFHVTDEAGRIQRTGTIAGQENGCVTFEDRDGYFYTLAGDVGDAAAGDYLVVEGPASRSVACPHADTIEVDRMEETEPFERPRPEPFR